MLWNSLTNSFNEHIIQLTMAGEKQGPPLPRNRLLDVVKFLQSDREDFGAKQQAWVWAAMDISSVLYAYRSYPLRVGQFAQEGIDVLHKEPKKGSAMLRRRAMGAFSLLKAYEFQYDAGGPQLIRTCDEHIKVELLDEPEFLEDPHARTTLDVSNIWQQVVEKSVFSGVHDRYKIREMTSFFQDSPVTGDEIKHGVFTFSQELFGGLTVLGMLGGKVRREKFYTDIAQDNILRAIIKAVRATPLTSLPALRERLGLPEGKAWNNAIKSLLDKSIIKLIEREEYKGVYVDLMPDGLNALDKARQLYPDELYPDLTEEREKLLPE